MTLYLPIFNDQKQLKNAVTIINKDSKECFERVLIFVPVKLGLVWAWDRTKFWVYFNICLSSLHVPLTVVSYLTPFPLCSMGFKSSFLPRRSRYHVRFGAPIFNSTIDIVMTLNSSNKLIAWITTFHFQSCTEMLLKE